MDISNQILFAEQQLFGFYSARRGETLPNLVKSMGLTRKEFETLIDQDMLDYLSIDEKDEISNSIK